MISIWINRSWALILFIGAAVLFSCAGNRVAGQSNFDLEPPAQASLQSSQVEISPDPFAMPTFQFATAELKGDGTIEVATKTVTQELLVSISSGDGVDPKLDHRGIRFIEKVAQNYLVTVPVTEQVDGKMVTKMQTEARIRSVPVIRFRKRNEEEQKEYENRLAVKRKEMAEGKKETKPKVEAAKLENITQKFTTLTLENEVVDGEVVTKMKYQVRTRTLQVARGKTKTTDATESVSLPTDQVRAYSVDGTAIDNDVLRKRLIERSPVILINSSQVISPFFAAILKPDAIFLVRKNQCWSGVRVRK